VSYISGRKSTWTYIWPAALRIYFLLAPVPDLSRIKIRRTMHDASSRRLREENGEGNDWGNWELHYFWFLVSEICRLEMMWKDCWFEDDLPSWPEFIRFLCDKNITAVVRSLAGLECWESINTSVHWAYGGINRLLFVIQYMRKARRGYQAMVRRPRMWMGVHSVTYCAYKSVRMPYQPICISPSEVRVWTA